MLAVLSLLLVSYSTALVWVSSPASVPWELWLLLSLYAASAQALIFPLAFLLLSCLSFPFVLCWHGLTLSSSYCYSTVISLSWHLLPSLKHAFAEVAETPLTLLDCSGSVPTVPKRQGTLTETQEDRSEHREALFYYEGDRALARVAW